MSQDGVGEVIIQFMAQYDTLQTRMGQINQTEEYAFILCTSRAFVVESIMDSAVQLLYSLISWVYHSLLLLITSSAKQNVSPVYGARSFLERW